MNILRFYISIYSENNYTIEIYVLAKNDWPNKQIKTTILISYLLLQKIAFSFLCSI